MGRINPLNLKKNRKQKKIEDAKEIDAIIKQTFHLNDYSDFPIFLNIESLRVILYEIKKSINHPLLDKLIIQIDGKYKTFLEETSEW